MNAGKPISFALLALAVLLPIASAQRGGGGGSGRGGFQSAVSGHSGGVRSAYPYPHPYPRNPYRRGLLWADPFFYPDGYMGDAYPGDAELREEFAGPPREPFGPALRTQAEPLMIELRGDRYVRLGGNDSFPATTAADQPDYAPPQGFPAASLIKPNATALTSAVLVFRDGHREDIPEYTIVGPTLYASAEYWQSGRWTRNIQISALDIAATRLANQERGVNFVLPSGPNVVVTRP